VSNQHKRKDRRFAALAALMVNGAPAMTASGRKSASVDPHDDEPALGNNDLDNWRRHRGRSSNRSLALFHRRNSKSQTARPAKCESSILLEQRATIFYIQWHRAVGSSKAPTQSRLRTIGNSRGVVSC
jgi:hypothetical protein